MKTQALLTLIAVLLLTGCMAVTRTAKFKAGDLSSAEFFGDLRLVNARQGPGNEASLKDVDAFSFHLVDQHNRTRYPQLDNISAQFGPLGQAPQAMEVAGSNTNRAVLLFMEKGMVLRNKESYRLCLSFDADGKKYQYALVGEIVELVDRDFFLIPLPNSGFSRAMK